MRLHHTPDHALIWIFLAALLASICIGASQNLSGHEQVNPSYDLSEVVK